MTPRAILLAHLGGHHLTRLAEALASKGLLGTLVTGICFRKVRGRRSRLPGRLARLEMDIGQAALKRSWIIGGVALFPQRFIPSELRKFWNHWMWWWFGKRAAKTLSKGDARIVIAFENSALALFRTARAQCSGICCVLECPSVHHSDQHYEPLTLAGERLVHQINSRKVEEIELADHIIVLSTFAKRTFVEAGIPERKLHVVPLGVETGFFQQRPMPPIDRPIRFLFAGTASFGKGVDILAQAFSQLRGFAELRFVGLTTPFLLEVTRGMSRYTIAGPVHQAGMREEFAAAHVLVLPSRFDGFGMVVSEAMSTGRPVIVSDHVGAADLVVTQGRSKSGWVVRTGDVTALVEAMQEAISRAAELAAMGQAARDGIEQFSWERYGGALEGIYRKIEAGHDIAHR